MMRKIANWIGNEAFEKKYSLTHFALGMLVADHLLAGQWLSALGVFVLAGIVLTAASLYRGRTA